MSLPEDALAELVNRIRRQPQMAREVDVSVVAQAVHGRWREHSDMLKASEEVPVAAWIVHKKADGLVRPDVKEPEVVPFNPDLRPPWLQPAQDALQKAYQRGQMQWGPLGSREKAIERPIAPVKDPSLWKLQWSYPILRPKKAPPVRIIEREHDGLSSHMETLLTHLHQQGEMPFSHWVQGRPRDYQVGSFLAVVHLWHEQELAVEQLRPYAPITLKVLPPGESAL